MVPKNSLPNNIFPVVRALVIAFVVGCLFFSVRQARILSNNVAVAAAHCASSS